MTKIDLKKELKALYQASPKEVTQVDVPEFNYLMVDGQGDPNTAPQYVQAVEALYSVSYAAKFAVRKGPLAVDYAVMPLQGLWWADDMAAFTRQDKALWRWTMMILQPQWVSADLLQDVLVEVGAKKDLPALDRLRLEPFTEGTCAQILHVGPFTEEGPTVRRLHDYVDAHGGRTGKHHEIYLSDVRRAAPANWKTIIRQPMRATA